MHRTPNKWQQWGGARAYLRPKEVAVSVGGKDPQLTQVLAGTSEKVAGIASPPGDEYHERQIASRRVVEDFFDVLWQGEEQRNIKTIDGVGGRENGVLEYLGCRCDHDDVGRSK